MPSITESLQETKNSLRHHIFDLQDRLNQLQDICILIDLCEAQFENFPHYSKEFRTFEILFFWIQPRLALETEEIQATLNSLKSLLETL